MCNAIAVTHVAVVYDAYWDRDIPTWASILAQKRLKSTAAARMADMTQLPATLVKLNYDTAKFVMAMHAWTLMAKMTSPSVCNPKTHMLAAGVAWWIVSQPGTANATRCPQVGKLFILLVPECVCG